jgi:beta-lactamase regulating signal transducer with metallopeptidase domain
MNELPFLLWTQLWQVTVVAAVVFAASKALASDRPHLAHALWVLVMLKCITPPVFSSQLSAFSWLTAEPIAVASFIEGAAIPSGMGLEGDVLIPRPVVVEAPGFGAAAQGTHPSEDFDSQTRTNAATAFAVDWKAIVVSLWLLGAIICLALQIARLTKFVFRIRSSETVDSKHVESLVARLATQLGVRQHVHLLVTESLVSPAVIGLLRPTVLVPSSVVEQPAKQLETLIAHELIHIRRGDLWWALLQTIAGAVFWFHPFVRFAVAAVTRESERSCDEETIASLGCDPVDYARSLLQILEQKQKLVVAPAVPGVKPIEVTSARLERVMKLGHGSQKRTPWWIWVVLIACSVAVLPGAGLLTAQETDEPQKDAAPLVELAGQYKGPVLVVKSYKIADIMEQLEKKHPDSEKEPLEAMLKRHVDGYLATLNSPDTVLFRTTEVRKGSLIASLPQEEHEQLRNYLPKVREHGLRLVIVESRLIRGWKSDSDGSFDWQAQKTSSFRRKKGQLVRTSHQDEVVQATVETDIAKAPIDEVNVASLINTEASENVQHELQDVSSLQQPVKQAMINDKQLKTLLSAKQHDIIESPTMFLYDEHEAAIKDRMLRPFVTSTIPMKGESGAIAHQPVISTLPQGAEMRVTPRIDGSDRVQLSGDFVMSKIHHVDTFTFEDKSRIGKSEESTGKVTIQLPVMNVAQLKFDSSLNSDQTLCLRTNDPETPGTDLVLLLTPRLVDEKLLSPVSRERESSVMDKYESYSNASGTRLAESTVDDEGEVLPRAYYIEDKVQLFKGDGSDEDAQECFEAICKKHDVSVTVNEVEQEVNSRADQLGLSKSKFLKIVSQQSGLAEAKLMKVYHATLCIKQLPSKERRRFFHAVPGFSPLVVRSKEASSDWPIDKYEYFEFEPYQIFQKTEAKVTFETGVTYLRGDNIQLLGDGYVVAAADKVEIRVDADGNSALKLNGNAELNFEGKMNADSIFLELNDDPVVTMEGNVSLGMGKAVVTADRVVFDLEESILVSGSAKIQFEGSEKPNIVGDNLEIRTGDIVIVDGTELGVKLGF